MLNDCPLQVLECEHCNQEYKRKDFYNKTTHNCIKNLLDEIKTCSDKIEEIKKSNKDMLEANADVDKKLNEL